MENSEIKNEVPVIEPIINNSDSSNLQFRKILVKVIYFIELFVNSVFYIMYHNYYYYPVI